MNPSGQIPSDHDLDQLLGSRLKRTSHRLEARWQQLFHAGEPPSARPVSRWRPRLLWPGLAVGAVAAALILMPHHARIRPSETLNAETLGGLFELEAALAPAEPLLDPENREAVLHLTPTNRSLP